MSNIIITYIDWVALIALIFVLCIENNCPKISTTTKIFLCTILCTLFLLSFNIAYMLMGIIIYFGCLYIIISNIR